MDTRIRNVPPDLWHRFKILCVTEKISMNQKLIDLVQKEVERAEGKKK